MAPVPDPNNVGGGGAAKRDEATMKVPSKDPKKKDDKKEDDLVSSISLPLCFFCLDLEFVGVV